MTEQQNPTRKLSAILSADVKGYSRLMSDDESYTIKTLKEYRDIMSGIIEKKSGRVVDTPGDNLMAEFPSIVNAVLSAVEIQRVLKQKNTAFPHDKKLEFRIGVNIGDVVQDGDRLYGEGVNIAARIEGLSDPGGVCISRGAYDHVKNKLSFGYEFIGQHSVKNIKDPVRVYKVLMDSKDAGKRINGNKKTAPKKYKVFKWIKITALIIFILFAGVAGYYWKYLHLSAPDDIVVDGSIESKLLGGPSIAVLPFDNMSTDPEQESFCDGMTDSLISSLSNVPGLLVIARNSTFIYKNKSIDVRQIGKELNAKYLIEGSIQKSNERYRFVVQIINTESGNHIWSGSYDREFKDIFDLQDEIILEILKAVGIKLTGFSGDESYFNGLVDENSFIKMVEIKDFWEHPKKEGFLFALKSAEEVVALNPEYRYRYDGISIVYLTAIFNNFCESPTICLIKASEAVKKSLSLDQDNFIALLNLGWIFYLRKEYDNAIKAFQKSLELSPNNAVAYHALGFALVSADEPSKALESIKKAIRLNPVTPPPYLAVLGWSYLKLEQYEKAEGAYKQMLKLSPNSIFAYVQLLLIYDFSGHKEKAKDTAKEVLRLNPKFTIKGYIKNISFSKDEKRRIDRVVNAFKEAGLPE